MNAFLFGVDCSKSARDEENLREDSGLTSDASRLQVNLEIALSGVSAKVKPSQPVFRWLKVR
jgi:hypothetical protein